ncbi:hypothetical protein [Mucilaginibacter polytrichastri]|uniref:Squalene cyclase C-terminal domain-containing protein n=1 Tax=Mucilaginibacter polytrichastri TaxID=1302689 RepID=A0A1Q6A0W9_9SPHI|nr:hypothetical protein [Mucilaginibacter polytrichastri]OKS87655.1 hypothetical protein RG47T_3117 [Mucilaginibacter polytrichastri]SFS93404.1 hypothetical protein SAMN04487890_106248 [Mucilaginibacter polytrichastri]
MIINYLLRSPEPSIQYKVRVNVLGEDPNSTAIQQLQQEVKASMRVKKLLSRQDASGKIISQRNIYDKWQGAHWILASLADIGYPPNDPSLIPVADQLLDFWLSDQFQNEFIAETKSKAYQQMGIPVMQGRHRRCASQQGNLLYMLLKLGINDTRIDELFQRLIKWQWPDGGWNCDKNPNANNSSFMETLLPLRGISLYAQTTGNTEAKVAAERAADIFLKRHLYKSQQTGQIIHPEFTLLHYPLYWHYDILGGLKVMAEAGFINDERCNSALDLLQRKELAKGGWPVERSHYKTSNMLHLGADYVSWGATSKTRLNEWVTADALSVLKAAGRISPGNVFAERNEGVEDYSQI